MAQRHPSNKEPSDAEKFAKVTAAGFDGICIDMEASEIDQFTPMKSLYEKHSLGCMVNAFPASTRDLKPVLQLAKDFNACMVNVIGGVMPVSLAGAVPVLYRWMDEAEDLGVPLLFETHRDGILNDLYYTLQIIDSIPQLRLCADLSHFVIDREMRLPLSDRDQGFMHRILERSDCFQGRVANREQIQVQVQFPQHQEWVSIFKEWWRQGMQMWKARNPADATLIFLCELGPPSYAMTDKDGLELSDRWEEALLIKSWVEQIWSELD